MSPGLSTTGFLPYTLQEIKALLEASFQMVYGLGIDLRAQSEAGQVIGIFSDKLAEEWEVTEAVWASMDPDQAEGAALDRTCAITGTIRLGAEPSTTTLWLTGDPDTDVDADSQVAIVNSAGTVLDVVFTTDSDVTITAVDPGELSTEYEVGDIVRSDDTEQAFILRCETAGESSNEPMNLATIDEMLQDNPFPTEVDYTFTVPGSTAEWRFLGWGAGAIQVVATGTEDGPVSGPARTIQHIATPVNGWLSVVNIEEAVLGMDLETDPELRTRRRDELFRTGTSTVDALRVDLLDVEDVTDAIVFENTTDETDESFIPAHSIEIFVLGGTDEAIGQVILDSKAAGIGTWGTYPVTVEDTMGVNHTYYFSRVEEIETHVSINVTVNPDLYPVDGDDLIAAAIEDFGNTFIIGRDVWANAIQSQAFTVPGVLNVTSCFLDEYESDHTSISLSQIARFSVAWITVTSSDGSPQ